MKVVCQVLQDFGHQSLSGAVRKGLGGPQARLTVLLLAATGVIVERDLQIGESASQTLEAGACTGLYTLE